MGAGMSVDGSTLLANVAGNFGGGISNQGTLTMGTSRLEQNSATSAANVGRGGGLDNVGTATLTDVQLIGNDADVNGGGIYVRGGTVTMIRGKIWNNKATTGTAVYWVNNFGTYNTMGGTVTNGTQVPAPSDTPASARVVLSGVQHVPCSLRTRYLRCLPARDGFRAGAGPPVGDKHLAGLVEDLSSPNFLIREAAAARLAECEAARPLLETAARSPDGEVRRRAVTALRALLARMAKKCLDRVIPLAAAGRLDLLPEWDGNGGSTIPRIACSRSPVTRRNAWPVVPSRSSKSRCG